MPIYGCHSEYGPLSETCARPQPEKDIGQTCDSAQQMQAMQSRQHIKKGAARARRQEQTLCGEVPPSHHLPEDEKQSKRHGRTEPWKGAGCCSTISQFFSAEVGPEIERTAANFQRDTAGQENRRVEIQNSRQLKMQPIGCHALP